MPNDWFQFKEFTVQQDRCAMKVSTDACIQGAWAAAQLKALLNTADKAPLPILDIGTGTGLLSLMLAQTAPNALIDAIELNPEACIQASENFSASAWENRLTAMPFALNNFEEHHASSGKEKYSFIICNPPFFHNQLQAQQKERNDARHSISMSKEELASAVGKLLGEEGTFCVMYPQREWDHWLQEAAQHGLFASRILEVRPNANTEINRVIGLFGKRKMEPAITDNLIIYDQDKHYTTAFRELLQSYYLAL